MERFFSYTVNEKGYIDFGFEDEIPSERRVQNLRLTPEQLAQLMLWHAMEYLMLDRLSPFDYEYEAAKEVLYEAVCRRRGANRLGFVEPELKII